MTMKIKNIGLKAAIAAVLIGCFSSSFANQRTSEDWQHSYQQRLGNHPENYYEFFKGANCVFGFSYHNLKTQYSGHHIFKLDDVRSIEINRNTPSQLNITHSNSSEVFDVSSFEYESPEIAYEELTRVLSLMASCRVDLHVKKHNSRTSPEKPKLY